MLSHAVFVTSETPQPNIELTEEIYLGLRFQRVKSPRWRSKNMRAEAGSLTHKHQAESANWKWYVTSETSDPIPSNTLPPAGSHLLNLPQQQHPLKHLSLQGGILKLPHASIFP